jgi:hypothetical protein
MRTLAKRWSGMLALVVCTSLLPSVALALAVETDSPPDTDGRNCSLLAPSDADQVPAASQPDGIAASKRRQRLKEHGAKHGEKLGQRLGGKRGAKIGKTLGRQAGSKAVHNGAKRLGRHLLSKAGL